jgi:hypothetical protein
MTPIQFIFIILAAITLGAAFMVVTSRILACCDMADRYIIRSLASLSWILAVAQVVIYIEAISILLILQSC